MKVMVEKKDKDKPAKEKKAKKAKDPNAPKGFGFTLRGAQGDTLRVQAKHRNGKVQTSVTHTVKNGDKKDRKIGARAEHDTPEAAKTWMDAVKAKALAANWTEKGRKGSKTDAFDLDSLPAATTAAQ